VILRTCKEILGASKHRPEDILMADVTAFLPPSPRESPACRRGMDRKNHGNSTCNGVGPSGIKEYRLTCRGGCQIRPFPDAELVQCMNKGGAPFRKRSAQQNSVSHRQKNTPVSHLAHSRIVQRKEATSGPIESSFRRQEAERGWKHVHVMAGPKPACTARNTRGDPEPRFRAGQPDFCWGDACVART
jgi:hypothetical protein